MTNFNSIRDFNAFSAHVTYQRRYILDERSREFLNKVKITGRQREFTIPSGTILFRAQVGCNKEDHIWDKPYMEERMRPLPRSASEGRVNPKGIPCMYLATNLDTALAEVRPGMGGKVSVAEFKVECPLNLIDFSTHSGKKVSYTIQSLIDDEEGKISSEDIHNHIWTEIDNAFSRPVTRNDLTSDYAPTQIIAEIFREGGYHGIQYKSGFTNGSNIALFCDSEKLLKVGAEPDTYNLTYVTNHLYEITSSSLQSREVEIL